MPYNNSINLWFVFLLAFAVSRVNCFQIITFDQIIPTVRSSTTRCSRSGSSTTNRRRMSTRPTVLSMSSQPQNQQPQNSPSPQPLYVDLTPQERILKEALGIEPESQEEKESRTRKRMAEIEKIQTEKRKNVGVAVLAFTAACLNYVWQYTHPVTSLSLLTEMQMKSDDITLIGKNGKPTV